MDYILHILIIVNIYIILASSFNLVIGYAGIFSIAHAAFYGIGAYAAALVALKLGWPFLLATLAAVAVAMVASLLIGFPSLRVRDIYGIIASFGFQIIVYGILVNWMGLTRGPLGIPGIPKPQVGSLTVTSKLEFFILTSLLAMVVLVILWRLAASPFGRALKAIREDEVAAQSLGKNLARFKILAFVAGSSLAAVSGSIFAHYVTYIDPSSFTLEESFFILALLIIGGSGNLLGPIIGALVVVTVPELLRFVGVSYLVTGPLRQVMWGLLTIVFLRLRPQGLLGVYFH